MARKANKNLDWLEWMTTRLQIINMKGERIRFVPNKNQIRLYSAIERQRQASIPAKVIILKGRKSGISTAVGAKFYTEVQNRPNRSSFVCAHEASSSSVLFRMVKLFDENLPDGEKKEHDYSSAKEIVWSGPHYSSYRVQTAGQEQLRRGDTLFYIHVSELAFYPNASSTMTALMNALVKPDSSAGSNDSIVIIESTANGIGGEFYERWQRACERIKSDPDDLNGFIPIFISWLDDAQNQMAVPAGYDWDIIDSEIAEDEPTLLDLCVSMGFSSEESKRYLYFRRYAILELMAGDVNRFRQEYPSTPDEAFLMSGRPAIPRSVITYHESSICPGERARLEMDPAGDQGEVIATYGDEYQNAFWEVWERPEPGKDYVVFGDVSEGRLSDPMNPRSSPDRHVGGVLERTDLKLVALLLSPRTFGGMPLDPDLFGKELVKAAWYYNEAWASPEMNAVGMAALGAFRGYGKTYLREHSPDHTGPLPLSQYGWRTDTSNRDLMIDECIAHCRPNANGAFENKVKVYSADLIDEEKTFMTDKAGKRQHRPGCHDDIWMTLCGLIQLHLRCPRERTTAFPGLLSKNRRKRGSRTGWKYAGGIDPGIGRLYPRSGGLCTK